MKKIKWLNAALILGAVLLLTPLSSMAAIGDTTVGDYDADGLGWLETYEGANGSAWGMWVELAAEEDPTSATGDYYFYSLSIDSAGSYYYQWDYRVDGLTEALTQFFSATTGNTDKEFIHNDQTGNAGAYYLVEESWNDSVSGSYDNYYYLMVDLDGDGNFYDSDYEYSAWSEYEAGTGVTESSTYLWDSSTGIYEYDYNWTATSGSYANETARGYDTDLDGDYYDNYYDATSTEYDAERSRQWTSRDLFDNVNYGGAGMDYYYYSYANLVSGDMNMEERLYIDTDENGSYYDYDSSGAYYSSTSSYYDASDTRNGYYSTLYDPYNHYYQSTSSYGYAGSGDYSTYYQLRVDTDGDGYYESNYDDYYYYEGTGYDAYDGDSWSYSDLYNTPEGYYQSTSSYSNTFSGDYDNYYYLVVDTDGDGIYEGGSNNDDYSYSSSEGYDAEDGWSYNETTLWDIPNGYYYATSSYSNAFSGEWGDWWEYAQDFNEDDYIQRSYQGDDAYQSYDSYYYIDGDLTETTTRASIDGDNELGSYYWAYTNEGSRGNGKYWTNTETADVNGYARVWSGYDIADWDNYEGNVTYNHSITQVYGTDGYYLETHNWAYDAGDNGTWTQYNQDTDGDTAWDNMSDFEIRSRSWNYLEGAEQIEGWYVDNYDTNTETRQEKTYSADVDTFYYYNSDGSTGDYQEMFLAYESGTTTPWTGSLETYASGDLYQWIWFDGGWSELLPAYRYDLLD